jgi:lipoic acid synthetase
MGDAHSQMSGAPQRRRKPSWLKVKAPEPRQYRATGALLDEFELHTVCREARCPNKGECFSSGTATFLILGETCTRSCRFCSVASVGAAPGVGVAGASSTERGLRAVDPDEPRRVAEAARRLGLRHVVITSVTRDDLPDGGAGQFAAAVAAVRAQLPGTTVEVLIPDLGGEHAALRAVLAAHPDVLNHNLETVPRLYPLVRPQADYERSLQLLRRAASWARAAASVSTSGGPDRACAPPSVEIARPRPLVKSGLIVGFDERSDEVEAVLGDCAAAGVDVVTIGQYLQPQTGCLPVARYVEPAEFASYEECGAALGLQVSAAPFVRSSYRAGELLERMAAGRPPYAIVPKAARA